MTMFGQLSQIEKESSFIAKQINEEIELIKRLQADFSATEQEAKKTTE
jgi:hypothetical protein